MSAIPTNQELAAKIKTTLVNNFGIDPNQITPEARLRDLGVDSLHVVEILLDLETEMGVKLTDLSFPPNPSLDDVAQTIAKNFSAVA